MSETAELFARLTVLETVVSQLITHMAVRDDDPPEWVRTRKTLALRAIDYQTPAEASRLRSAAAALFKQAEMVAGEYTDPARDMRRPEFAR